MHSIEAVTHEKANGFRRLASRKPVRVIAVTGGKGGVGKTNVSVNLAIAIANQGKEVMLMDADLGLGNVDVLLGLRPSQNLSHVIEGRCSLEQIIVAGPSNLKLVPAASGLKDMSTLSAAQHGGLIRAFSDLAIALDVLVVDTAAGISESVISFSNASQEIVVVVCDEPASITDAYALMKVLHHQHGQNRFRILANMVRSANEGRELFIRLARATDRFLSVSLDYMGAIPFDEYMRTAVKRQHAVLEAFPRSKAALAFKTLATVVEKWPLPEEVSGHLGFFIDRLIQSSQAYNGVAA